MSDKKDFTQALGKSWLTPYLRPCDQSTNPAGNHQLGDRIDRACRWVFPLAYFGLGLLSLWDHS